MKEILLEGFRHHAWANKQLLAACRGLPHEQLTLPGTAAGTDRNILAILNHITQSDRGYVSRRGERPDWAENEEDTADLDELERRVDENAQVWERFLSQPLDATKLIILDQGAYEAEQSVLVVQALHHGNAHPTLCCGFARHLPPAPHGPVVPLTAVDKGDWRQADVADEPGGHRRSSSIGSQMSK